MTVQDVKLRMQITDEMISNGIGMKLKQSVVAYWTFNEASGTAFDSSTNNLHLSEIDGTSRVPMVIGNGLSIDSVNDYLGRSTASSQISFGDTEYSIAFWVKITGWSGSIGERLLFRHSNLDGSDWEYEVSLLRGGDDKGILSFYTSNNSITNAGMSTYPSLDINVLYFIVIDYSHDANEIRMRVNNDESAINSILAGDAAGSGGFFVGGNSPHLFIIDELFILNRRMTPEEMTYMWNGGNGRTLFP